MHRDGTHGWSELPGATGPRLLVRPPTLPSGLGHGGWERAGGSVSGQAGGRTKVDGSAKGTCLLAAGRGLSGDASRGSPGAGLESDTDRTRPAAGVISPRPAFSAASCL